MSAGEWMIVSEINYYQSRGSINVARERLNVGGKLVMCWQQLSCRTCSRLGGFVVQAVVPAAPDLAGEVGQWGQKG